MYSVYLLIWCIWHPSLYFCSRYRIQNHASVNTFHFTAPNTSSSLICCVYRHLFQDTNAIYHRFHDTLSGLDIPFYLDLQHLYEDILYCIISIYPVFDASQVQGYLWPWIGYFSLWISFGIRHAFGSRFFIWLYTSGGKIIGLYWKVQSELIMCDRCCGLFQSGSNRWLLCHSYTCYNKRVKPRLLLPITYLHWEPIVHCTWSTGYIAMWWKDILTGLLG